MNIFWIDRTLKGCAQAMCDKHVVKMCLEYTQLLSNVHHSASSAYSDAMYLPTHYNHPVSRWARESSGNYLILLTLALHTLCEYNHRYGKTHKCTELYVKKGLLTNPLSNVMVTPTIPPVVAYGTYFGKDSWDGAVEAYREYYLLKVRDNPGEFYWHKNRPMPDWLRAAL